MFVYELLNNEDMNLIFVEWGNGAAFPYHMAVGNTRLVGELCSVLKSVFIGYLNSPYSFSTQCNYSNSSMG